MDGNNSLKRMRPLGGRKAGDVRVFHDSDYFLPQDFVNTFSNEVRVTAVPKDDPSPARNDINEIIPRPGEQESLGPINAQLATRSPLPLNVPCVNATTTGDHSTGPGVHDHHPIPEDLAPQTGTSALPDGETREDDVEGDPTDGAGSSQSSCTKNWKAAQSDDKKRLWDVFEETGVFASACRHGFILWIIDMV